MEIEWTVTPEGNPSDIRLEFPAVERFEYTAEKSLILHLGDRHQIEVSDLKAQQMLPNQRVDVPARIEYLGESQIGITAGAYVTGEPLRISLRVKSDLELIKEYSSNATQPGSNSHTTEADGMVARPASAGKRGQFSGAATDVFTVDPVPDIAIPDNGYNGTLGSMASVTIDTSSLPVGSTVDDVTISIDLAHTFIGDLTIKLESPSGSVLGIVSRPGAVETADDGNDAASFGENSNWGGSILFSDAGPVSAEQMGKVPADLTTLDTVCVTNGQCHYSPAPGSIATPPSTFAGFDGQNARGNWRLYVGDSAAADTGTFRSVTLTLTTSPSSTTVSSINTSGANPLCNTISGTTVTWDVTFAASVTGVTASNFSLVDVGNTLTGESISSVSGSGTAWTVTANTGTGAGTLRLDMANSTGITPTVTNVPFTGQTFTINAPATVNAGPDQTVCAGSAVTLAGIIGGSASNGTWSGGAGTFNPNNTTLNAVYTPSAGEVTAGTVTLTLTTDDPTGPCLAVSDTMTITINPAATVNAGADQTVCASSPAVTLAGIIGGSASNGTWSGGGGTFTPNATTLNASYTPSAGEVSAGTVTLTLTTNDPAGPCGAVGDTVTITITAGATVNAGADQTVCASSPAVTLAGIIGGSASNGTWSGGAGTFTPNTTTLNAVYTPSAGEISAGTVTLTLTTDDPAGPCGAVSDTVTITIQSCASQYGVMVADTTNNRIQAFDGTTWTVLGVGTLGSGNGQFRLPEAVAFSSDGQRIYVADTGNNRIQWSTDGGATWANFATNGTATNQVKAPQGLALDTNGNLYVSDTGNGRVMRFNGGTPGSGVVIATTGTASGQVGSPRGLVIDSTFRLFVTDETNSRILRILNANTTVSGTSGSIIAGTGTGMNQVRNPQGITIDSNGTLFVADTGNSRILRWVNANPATATTMALTGSGLGQVNRPEGVTVVSFTSGPFAGGGPMLIVGDTSNNRIQGRFIPTGSWSLIGSPNNIGSGAGQFRAPSKIQ